MTPEHTRAIVPLETFLKNTGGTKTAQYAGQLLGQAYEETNNPAKARDVYEHAAGLYPGSEFAPAIRNRLRRVQQQLASAPAATTPAAPK